MYGYESLRKYVTPGIGDLVHTKADKKNEGNSSIFR